MKITNGYTLIELMITLSILGVMMLIALPVYTQYRINAEVSEGLGALSHVKNLITEGFISGGPGGVVAVAATQPQVESKYVASLTISGALDATLGEITVTFGNEADTAITSETLVLSPRSNLPNPGTSLDIAAANGSIDWGCSSATQTISTSRSLNGTAGTVQSRYVPLECR